MAEKTPHPFLITGQENKGPSIVPRMKEFEQANEAGGEPEHRETSKHEVYALVGHIMKGVMQEVVRATETEDIMRVNAARVIQDDCPLLKYENGQFILNNEEVATPAEVAKSIWSLRYLLKYFVHDVLQGDIANLDAGQQAAFDRLDKVVKNEKHKWNRQGTWYQGAYSLINSGVGTASHETWLIMNAIPKLFYQKFGRDITETEFDQLLQDGGEILLKVASFRADMIEPVTESQMSSGQPALALADQRYEIIETDTGLSLGFREDYLNKRSVQYGWYQDITYNRNHAEQRHGCPVRDIRLENKQGRLVSGVQAVVDFYTPLAKQVILPNQKALRGGLPMNFPEQGL